MPARLAGHVENVSKPHSRHLKSLLVDWEPGLFGRLGRAFASRSKVVLRSRVWTLGRTAWDDLGNSGAVSPDASEV